MNSSEIRRLRDLLQKSGAFNDDIALDTAMQNLIRDDDEYSSTCTWLRKKQQDCLARIKQIGLHDVMNGPWRFSDSEGNIEHSSGGFFRIIGVDVSTDQRESGKGWKQPMVDQGTESSIAGFIRRKQEYIYHYLVEAKFEPGNYGKVLLSPSLQVTYSNLNQAHGGKRPRYAEYFGGGNPSVTTIYEKWQPEDGGRFFLKRVKYMIVEIDDVIPIEINDNFRWVTVNTLKRMLHLENLINPHVRSLLAVL